MTHYTLLAAGLFCTIAGTVLFAVGWERMLDHNKRSNIAGALKPQIVSKGYGQPEAFNLGFRDTVTLTLRELDGVPLREAKIDADGRFFLAKVPPGEYILHGAGKFISCPERTVNVYPQRDSFINDYACTVEPDRHWKQLFGKPHSIYSRPTAKDTLIFAAAFDGDTLWLGGKDQEPYLLVRSEVSGDPTEWHRVYIPEAEGSSEIRTVFSASSGTLILGFLFGKPLYSLDHGEAWNAAEFPEELRMLSNIVELRDGTLVGTALNRYAGTTNSPSDNNAAGAIVRSRDDGKSWERIFASGGSSRSDDCSFFGKIGRWILFTTRKGWHLRF